MKTGHRRIDRRARAWATIGAMVTATDGKPSVVARTLDRFGTSKIKAAQEEHEKRIQEVTT